MNWNAATRRHFLRGTGKAALTLPFLPSLLPEKDAQAQAAARQKTFIGFAMMHGMIPNMISAGDGAPSTYMPAFKNMQSFQAPGRHVIHHKTLEAAKTDGGGQVSDVFDSAFNPYLSKMLFLQGFDFYPFFEAHQSGHFGNGATALTGGTPALRPAHASIDQVMAYSTNFYKNPALLGKSVVWTGNYGEFNSNYSHTFADPANKLTSAIVGVNAIENPQSLWDKFFKGFTGSMPPPIPTGPTLQQKLADRVLQDYKAFVANPRLGKDDKARVDRHIALLSDTQKSLNSMTQQMVTIKCDTAPAMPPGFPVSRTLGYVMRKQMLQVMNDVIVSLIACGLCHSYVAKFHSLLVDDTEQWHAWAHAGAPEHKQQTSAVLHDVVLDLVAKLDRAGLLDDTLVLAPQENSLRGHEDRNISVVSFGSAGGALKTGQYVDYRNMAGGGNDVTNSRWGFPMTQLFANALTAMDVPAAEFEALNRDPNPFFVARSGYGSSAFATQANIAPLQTTLAQFKGRSLSEGLPLITV